MTMLLRTDLNFGLHVLLFLVSETAAIATISSLIGLEISNLTNQNSTFKTRMGSETFKTAGSYGLT